MVVYNQGGSAPKPPQRSIVSITNFRGADMSNSETAMDIGRSGYCPNMTRAAPGKVRKRMGYQLYSEYDGAINGCWRLGDKTLVHAGTGFYVDGERVSAELNNAVSSARQYNGKLYILDGKSFFVYGKFDDAWALKRVSEVATVPTAMIDRDPVGGGTAYEDINILSDKWTELFFSDGKSTAYQMSFGDLLTTVPVVVKKLKADGISWETLTEGKDYSVNYTTGIITFVTAPGQTPIGGQSNISITVAKDRSDKRKRVEKCTFMTSYGDDSSGNRIFCSGNPEFPHWDFWSDTNDPSYFSDLNYAMLGRDDSAIVGYSVLGSYLAAHKDDRDGSIYVRSIVTDTNDMNRQTFPITNVIKGRGALSPHSFAYLTQEPLFLTPQGVFAITTQDLTAEKYEQRRSFYIDNMLLKEKEADLKNAYACIYQDLYLLAVNGTVYVLDGTTTTYEKGEPYATYQYECFYWTNIPARIMWVHDGRLFFGTPDGRIFRFYNQPNSVISYNDNGKAIAAAWQTSALQGSLFYKNKNFKRCSVQLAPATATGCFTKVRRAGVWSTLFNANTSARYLKFSSMQFSKFCFTSDDSPRTIGSKIKVKKVDKAAFRFINDQLGEPFGLEAIAFEFIEGGNFKG